ncbi:MAG: hypothetical protein KAU31_11225 [Spirochaetaceae bacterium]|nr:hypothetical protein [Spirochaetaceae bacterium]
MIALLIMLARIAATAVGAVWLIVEAQWILLIVGLAIGIGGSFVIGLLVMPNMFLGSLATNSESRSAAVVLAAIALLYLHAMALAEMTVIIRWFQDLAGSHLLIPSTLWAAAVSNWPFAALAAKDAKAGMTESSVTTTFFQVAALTTAIPAFIGDREFPSYFLPMLGVVLISYIYSVVSAAKATDT